MKIYLDVCCLNRPFDEHSQERIRLESEAVITILDRSKTLTLLTSEIVDLDRNVPRKLRLVGGVKGHNIK